MPPRSEEWTLKNPQVSGAKTTVEASSSGEALKEIWNGIGRYLSSPVKSMYVTLQNKNGTLAHHIIEETHNGKSIDFRIKDADVKLSKETAEKFEKESDRVARTFQAGGADSDEKKKKSKKHDDDEDDSSSSSSADEKKKKKHKSRKYDDDSSSSSSSDVYRKRRHRKVKYDDVWLPPTQWWYAAMYGADYLYIPTFVSPLTPSIQISQQWVPALLY
jgi:hypothetical protein